MSNSFQWGEISRCYAIRYERSTPHSPERLWRAITEASEITAWMSYPARVNLRVGGDYFVDFSRTTPADNLDGVIVRVDPGRELTYAWGVSVIQWLLEPEGDGCRYTFLHHGMARRDIPEEHGVAVGWHLWLDDMECHLAGQPLSSLDPSKLGRLAPVYRDRLAEVLNG